MHRKNLIFPKTKHFVSQRRDRAALTPDPVRVRSIPMLPVFLGFTLAFLPLKAAPDPDLFDGRITQESSGGSEGAPESPGGADSASTGGDGAEGSAPEEASNTVTPGGGSSTDRDFDEIGDFGGGQEMPDSEGGASDGGTSEARPGGGEGTTGQSGSASSAATDEGSEPAGSSTADKSEGDPRDFSQIGGIRGGGGSQGVEVNTSKTTPTSPAGEGSRPVTGSSEPEKSQPGQGTGGSGSKPTTGSGSGDFGDTLPSGI